VTDFLNATDFRHRLCRLQFTLAMPVTRSSSLLASRNAIQPLGTTKESRQEVIVLSDRDDEPSGTRNLSRKATRRRRPNAKEKPAFVLGDVLEISSDDEPSPSLPKQSKQSSTLSKLQAQIQILQKVCRRIQCAYMRLRVLNRKTQS
jgi:hypothetical protein